MTDYNSKAHLELIDKQAKLLEQMMTPTMFVTQKTLRDEFAMAAMTGLMAINPAKDSLKGIAEFSYVAADAMMEARK
jgi:hypothetical protein